ncbi:MAG: hypothetical protein Q4P07_10540 [Ornithinimicrobium sp.]|nr:hypothetical protein [Ornithinimicrobium sp.]
MMDSGLGEPLLDRWLADAALLAPEAGPDLWLAEGSLLLRGWGEPHRRYHTVEHLMEVLAAVDELASSTALCPDDSLLARTIGWYHDLSYDPRAAAGSNEHRSATMARDHLHRLGVDLDVIDVVEAGVLMTVDHQVGGDPLQTVVLDVFHDADLWILSAPAARYATYCQQVRQEYAHVPDDLFRVGRLAVLTPFLTRERLYRTDHAHHAWTDRARANVSREVEVLGASAT